MWCGAWAVAAARARAPRGPQVRVLAMDPGAVAAAEASELAPPRDDEHLAVSEVLAASIGVIDLW